MPDAPKLTLIPWDYTSEAHVTRMLEQRRACGWMAEDVPAWAAKATKGLKTMFWVVLPDSFQGREDLLEAHKKRYPSETTPLQDTARSLNLVPREPSGSDFTPIGHVALNKDPTPDLVGQIPDEGVYWIANLYISPCAQRRGLGRAVMSHLESLVSRSGDDGDGDAALAGTTIALDTPPSAWHIGAWAKENFYDPLNLPMPKISTQEWYEQQGYSVFTELPDHRPTPLPRGGSVKVPLVLLKKVLR